VLSKTNPPRFDRLRAKHSGCQGRRVLFYHEIHLEARAAASRCRLCLVGGLGIFGCRVRGEGRCGMVCIVRGQRVRVEGQGSRKGRCGMAWRCGAYSLRKGIGCANVVSWSRKGRGVGERKRSMALFIVTDSPCGPKSAQNDSPPEKIGDRITLPALGELLDHLIVIHPRPPSSQRKLLSAFESRSSSFFAMPRASFSTSSPCPLKKTEQSPRPPCRQPMGTSRSCRSPST